MAGERAVPRLERNDVLFLGAFALLKFVVNAGTTTGYGYFRDELYYLDCANHLAWGYVDHPPLSIAILAAFRAVFGESLFAVHLPAILAGCATVVLAGLIARQMGGGRFAQAVACLCVIIAPVFLVMGTFFSMNPIDQFFWALATYVLVRLIVTDNPQLWLWFGVVAGFGLLNKISVLFLGFSVVVAMALTPHRKYFLDKHLWLGCVIALAIFVPHLIWQVLNGWPTIEFTRNAALGKNLAEGPLSFFLQQFLMTNPITVPLWLGGLYFGLFHPQGKRFRWLALAFVIVFLLLSLSYGKGYYLAPAFPVVFALGGVGFEHLTVRRRAPRVIYASLLATFGALFAPYVLPVLPIDTFLRFQSAIGITTPRQEVGHTGAIPQHFGDRFGWPEMVALVAKAYQELPAVDRQRCGILTSNYGEAGAINFFGREHGLPRA
ncbi:MAG: glycosyltransferase family 39 protein, partial [Candidatus Hydrogenedentes bacterium]|nr:glycosyltransferase family 39 protein [Candidatus Hydrogenedentota bacterium]